MRRARTELGLVLLPLAGALGSWVSAQPPAPAPPRVEDPQPGGAALAHLPDATHEGIEEVVVVGQRGYGLPDLGSSFRPPPTPPGRFEFKFLPLYDPERPERTTDLFAYTPENQRIHYIELFRVQFGRHR
jgi:hypothetical protein